MNERPTVIYNDWQTVKLLNGKDGKPIELGDTVWGEDGKKWRIVGIGENYVWGNQPAKGGQKRLKPEWLTHTEPDSWERILKDAMYTPTADYCEEHSLVPEVAETLLTTELTDLVRRCEALAVQHG